MAIGPFPRAAPRRARVYLPATCVAAATLYGCATTYRPTEPRWQEAAGLRAVVTDVQGPLQQTQVSLETAGPQRIEAVRLGVAGQRPCGSGEPVGLVDATSGETIELPQDLDGAARVELAIPRSRTAIPGLTLDVEAPVVVDGSVPAQPRCLRLPLTASDRVL